VRHNEQRQVKSLNPSLSGTGNLALETVPGEKGRRNRDSNKVPVLCAVRKWLWNAGR
jgi:hypothetical protein